MRPFVVVRFSEEFAARKYVLLLLLDFALNSSLLKITFFAAAISFSKNTLLEIICFVAAIACKKYLLTLTPFGAATSCCKKLIAAMRSFAAA